MKATEAIERLRQACQRMRTDLWYQMYEQEGEWTHSVYEPTCCVEQAGNPMARFDSVEHARDAALLAKGAHALLDAAEALEKMQDPIQTAANRCLAQDGPVGDDLLEMANDSMLRSSFDHAFRKGEAALTALARAVEENDAD